MSDPTRRLREIADAAPDPKQAERIRALAAELEKQHNDQNNAFQVALSLTDLHLSTEIDQLRTEMTQRLDDSNARQRQILTMLEELQTDLRALNQRQVGDNDASNAAGSQKP